LLGPAEGLSALMRPILFAVALAIGAVPALERICDLRCAALPSHGTTVAGDTHHCDGMPAGKTAPRAPARNGDPCGHGHGGTAILGASATPVRGGAAAPPPALLFASVGSGGTASLPAREAISVGRAAESPPRASSPTILRL
jgi:hypothetical protein